MTNLTVERSDEIVGSILSELAAADWFGAGGKSTPLIGVPLRQVSLKEVLASLEVALWEPGRLTMKKERTHSLYEQGVETATLNNEFTRLLRPRVEEALAPMRGLAAERLGIADPVLRDLWMSVNWDVVAAGQTRFFSLAYDLPRVCDDIFALYLRGHLPGAWSGAYPKGHLLVW